jgi:hypothetical protein
VENGTLRIVEREGSSEISEVVIPGFNPLAPTLSGTFVLYSLSPPGGVIGQGTITLTALN